MEHIGNGFIEVVTKDEGKVVARTVFHISQVVRLEIDDEEAGTATAVINLSDGSTVTTVVSNSEHAAILINQFKEAAKFS